MKYLKLKQEILQNIKTLTPNDFYLVEGKLIFRTKQNADLVKNYLESKNYSIVEGAVRNWTHWKNRFESILYFKNLQKESNG